jgi:hypothetical protein
MATEQRWLVALLIAVFAALADGASAISITEIRRPRCGWPAAGYPCCSALRPAARGELVCGRRPVARSPRPADAKRVVFATRLAMAVFCRISPAHDLAGLAVRTPAVSGLDRLGRGGGGSLGPQLPGPRRADQIGRFPSPLASFSGRDPESAGRSCSSRCCRGALPAYQFRARGSDGYMLPGGALPRAGRRIRTGTGGPAPGASRRSGLLARDRRG